MDFLLVGAGGFLGAIVRFGVHTLEKQWTSSTFPYGTLLINVTGCFFAGLILSFIEIKAPYHRQIYLFVMAGFLSSFTTFSTFSAETLNLIKSGSVISAGVSIIMNLVFGLLATWIGRSLIN